MMLIAHRGFRNPNGENRMVDFIKALKVCKGVEFDIRMTKDKRIIIFHDHNFKRIGNVDKTIRNFTYEQIKELPFFKNNPEWLPPLFIEDFIDKISDQYKVINVEIKPDRYSEQEFEIIKNALNYLASKTNAEIIVSSFGLNALQFISQLDNHFKKGYLFEFISQIDMSLLQEFDYIHPYVGFLKRKNNIEFIKKLNKKMNIWTFKNNNNDVKILHKIYGPELIYAYISDIPNLVINP
ncbi:glycerophosphodiester phosphodiesterase [Spiroplasma culicicola]|uniref:Glycerophosphoryl diester phosphodiesterase n=1 Tax=Spiroplasma culicicola AES-1 TaxID=1276246 RepID=W6A6D6_9MOLU|nr:glycerophosphodiester phosphodiesterase family protein [Spiroplasma culicicola]AHI52410.1 glycerophosphoryl diester phosphodiesterase [Spiroplasma culicicola AES-1]